MDTQNDLTMSDKLFNLCELQLLSIIEQAESSILKVTESTSAALKMSSELSEVVSGSDCNHSNEVELCAELEQRFNLILTNMQFFDEFSQRIEHIKEIVDLIKIESDREGFLSDEEDSEKLFNEIKNIFSIRTEFEVMRKIFPEHIGVGNNVAIELF